MPNYIKHLDYQRYDYLLNQDLIRQIKSQPLLLACILPATLITYYSLFILGDYSRYMLFCFLLFSYVTAYCIRDLYIAKNSALKICFFEQNKIAIKNLFCQYRYLDDFDIINPNDNSIGQQIIKGYKRGSKYIKLQSQGQTYYIPHNFKHRDELLALLQNSQKPSN